MPHDSDDSVREDIAFIRRAVEQGRGYAGARSLDMLIWGIAVAIGYLGTYAAVRGWWRIESPAPRRLRPPLPAGAGGFQRFRRRFPWVLP